MLPAKYKYAPALHRLQTSFDSINSQFTYEAKAEFRIPSKLVTLTKMILEMTNNKVKIQNKLSDSYMTNTGMRQGDSLSTALFNITLKKFLEKYMWTQVA
jgi:hypothetical protein